MLIGGFMLAAMVNSPTDRSGGPGGGAPPEKAEAGGDGDSPPAG